MDKSKNEYNHAAEEAKIRVQSTQDIKKTKNAINDILGITPQRGREMLISEMTQYQGNPNGGMDYNSYSNADPSQAFQNQNSGYTYQPNPVTETNYGVSPTPTTGGLRVVSTGEWSVSQVIREGKDGKETKSFRVTGAKADYHTDFRHRVVAESVAAFLNETNGMVDDRRIRKIEDLCEEETALLKSFATTKRLMESSGDTDLKSDLERVGRRIKEIRSILGVN